MDVARNGSLAVDHVSCCPPSTHINVAVSAVSDEDDKGMRDAAFCFSLRLVCGLNNTCISIFTIKLPILLIFYTP